MIRFYFTLAAVFLLSFSVQSKVAFSDQKSNSAWSLEAPEKTPYGNVAETLKILHSDDSVTNKTRALNKLGFIGQWYLKEKKSYVWIEKIVTVLLEEAQRKGSPYLQMEAISSLQDIQKNICGEIDLNKDILYGIEKIVTTDPNPEVRKEILGIGPMYTFILCPKNEQFMDRAVKTVLQVLARDPNLDVLDEAASCLRFCMEKGAKLPDDTKEAMARAVRQRMMIMMPDEAWAAFSRGPYKFHHWTEIHELLIKSPFPNNPKIAAFAMIPIDYSIKYAKDLPQDSTVRLDVLLLKYLLCKNSLYATGKSSKAELSYMGEAMQQDQGKSVLELAQDILNNAGKGSFVNQAALPSAANMHIDRAKKSFDKDGGFEGLAKKISFFVFPNNIKSAQTRLKAWHALNIIQVEYLSLEIMNNLKQAKSQETDPACLESATSLINKIN